MSKHRVCFSQARWAYLGVRLSITIHHDARIYSPDLHATLELPQRVPVSEDPIDDPEICIGSGYSESKWVAERILLEANKTDLNISVVRLGQISGGYNGYWNEREWFPAIVKSAIHIRCLPALELVSHDNLLGDQVDRPFQSTGIAWVPAHEAATVLTELRDCKEPVLHLAHPSPVPWTTVIKPIAADLGVALVSYTIWLAALEDQLSVDDTSSMDKMRVIPALRLLDHFRSHNTGPSKDSMGEVRMDVSKLWHELPDLHIPAITADSARRWIEAWRKCGFMPEAT
ncbi:hypothetical protein EIP86_009483 [Pleurotus ostreatoroseus]|nr:hypothetical protein EIP86_009483 [Pleurotus ostreatoroseus]